MNEMQLYTNDIVVQMLVKNLAHWDHCILHR